MKVLVALYGDTRGDPENSELMDVYEYQQYDAVGLSSLLSRSEVAAADLIHCAIAVIEDKNPTLNAVIATDFDRALEQAKKFTTVDGFGLVPFLVKDLNTNVAHLPSTSGSRAFTGLVPKQDSELIKRYRHSGLAILGKTNTPEFGLNFCTEPSLFGPARHPVDERYSVGGSSGGSAAAVASGMVPMAHATDSGGSIRIPASNCGLFGLKPTRGRVPLGNDMPEGLAGFSTAHCVSHSVRDSARLLELSAGSIAGDPYQTTFYGDSFLDALGTPWLPYRVGFWNAGFAGETVDPICQLQVTGCVELLEDLGCEVEEVRPDIDGNALRSAFDVLWSANVEVLVSVIEVANAGQDLGTLIEPVTLACANRARELSAADYVQALRQIQQAGRALGMFFNQYDVLLTPTLAHPPRPIGFLTMQMEDWSDYLNVLLDEIPFTPLYNATGTPAASIPFGETNERMPIGIQLGAAFGNESLLLRVAAEIERARPWHKRR